MPSNSLYQQTSLAFRFQVFLSFEAKVTMEDQKLGKLGLCDVRTSEKGNEEASLIYHIFRLISRLSLDSTLWCR